MTTITIVTLYLLGALITCEYYTLQDRYPLEFIIFSSVFYPLIGLVWILLFILAIISGAIYGIGEKIRETKGRAKTNERNNK